MGENGHIYSYHEVTYPIAFLPESYELITNGRSSDSLRFELPSRKISGIRGCSKLCLYLVRILNCIKELTATGIVRDFHPVPFSSEISEPFA